MIIEKANMLDILTYSGRQTFMFTQHKISSSIILDYINAARLEIANSCI